MKLVMLGRCPHCLKIEYVPEDWNLDLAPILVSSCSCELAKRQKYKIVRKDSTEPSNRIIDAFADSLGIYMRDFITCSSIGVTEVELNGTNLVLLYKVIINNVAVEIKVKAFYTLSLVKINSVELEHA